LVPVRTELRRVLVFFGGVDTDNLTGRTVEALMDPALAHLAVDVVLGCQSPHRQAVADCVAQRPFTTLHGPLPSLAGLMARADLAIGAGGATTWERACLGLASLVTPISANQEESVKALEREGIVLVVPYKSFAESLLRSLKRIVSEPASVLTLTAQPLKSIDGCGVKLIVDRMIKEDDQLSR